MTDLAQPFNAAPELSERRAPHPLFHAGKWIIADLLSTFLFVGLFAFTHSVFAATGFAIAAGIAQFVYLKVRGSAIDAMQWMSLALVVICGGASLLTHDARFVMLKPTLIYCAVGTVMLKPGWMVRYIPAAARPLTADVTLVFGFIWAGLMFSSAGLNLVLAAYGDPKVWAWFLGVFPLSSKLALFGVQYMTTRFVALRRKAALAAG